MSLIIKGMKLPENDGMKELVIGRAPNGTEPIAIVSGDITEFYKIVEIPTPHGRLIDADKLTQWIEYSFSCYRNGDKDTVKLVINDIKRQSTIIGAEADE